MSRIFGWAFVSALALVSDAAAQSPTLAKILSSEIAISRDRAEIQLEFEDGRKLTAATAIGSAPFRLDGTGTGDQNMVLGVRRGDSVDRSWRELLNAAMEAPPETIGEMLHAWSAPDESGARFDRELDAALAGVTGAASPAQTMPPALIDDSVVKLERRIEELQERLEAEQRVETGTRRGPDWLSPFRRVWIGFTQLFGVIVTAAVIFGIGFVTILFGGRKYLEGVADTVRAGAGRSFLVGLAGVFLVVPVFVLGVIALAISIVGIPALLLWVPVFPIACALAVALGYLGVAHAAGESWGERNIYGSEWFRRGNSYYFLASGLTLLLGLFAASAIIYMIGPWFNWLKALLLTFAILVTIASSIIGFGAVLISRGGSRPAGRMPDQASLFPDDANV